MAACRQEPDRVRMSRRANDITNGTDLDNTAVALGVVRVPILIDHSRDATEEANTTRAIMVITCRHRISQWENLRSYRADSAEMPERYIRQSGVHSFSADSTANTLWARFCPAAVPAH